VHHEVGLCAGPVLEKVDPACFLGRLVLEPDLCVCVCVCVCARARARLLALLAKARLSRQAVRVKERATSLCQGWDGADSAEQAAPDLFHSVKQPPG
jgi:hypothetical protein